jgi:hypothetical protein
VLDHLLIFSARHLEAVIKEFLVHYHQARPHQGLDQRCPAPAEPNVVPLPMHGQIVRHDRLGGLLHHYSWILAAATGIGSGFALRKPRPTSVDSNP